MKMPKPATKPPMAPKAPPVGVAADPTELMADPPMIVQPPTSDIRTPITMQVNASQASRPSVEQAARRSPGPPQPMGCCGGRRPLRL